MDENMKIYITGHAKNFNLIISISDVLKLTIRYRNIKIRCIRDTNKKILQLCISQLFDSYRVFNVRIYPETSNIDGIAWLKRKKYLW